VARELGPAERDHQLPQRDDRPAPDEDTADRRQSEEEEGEDARRRRDVAERDGERAEAAERALQLLLVAEPCEIRLVARRLVRRRFVDVNHGTPPGRMWRRFTLLPRRVSMERGAKPRLGRRLLEPLEVPLRVVGEVEVELRDDLLDDGPHRLAEV